MHDDNSVKPIFMFEGYFYEINLLYHKRAASYKLELLLYTKEKVAARTGSNFCSLKY